MVVGELEAEGVLHTSKLRFRQTPLNLDVSEFPQPAGRCDTESSASQVEARSRLTSVDPTKAV